MSSTNPERSSEEIRRDIERTRAHMDETVEELRDRLSPGQVVDELWGRFRRSGRGAGDVVRGHAVPLALMGLGVAWLAVEEATGSSKEERHGTHPRRGSYDDGSRGLRDKASDAAGNAAHSVGDAARSAKDSVRDAKDWVGDRMERAGEVGDSAREAAHRAADAARHAGRQTRDRLDDARHRAADLMEDSPLMIGALSFGVGLASGLAVPTSRMEDRLMGDRSEDLKREARGRARELTDEAKQVAADAAESARETVQSDIDDRLDTTAGDPQVDGPGRGYGEPRV